MREDMTPFARFALEAGNAQAGSPLDDVVHGQHSILRSHTQVAVAGVTRYYLPTGLMFLDTPGETTLSIDGVAQVEGVDYENRRRRTPPASVADAAIGFRLLALVPAGGEVLTFTWTERGFSVSEFTVAPVYFNGPVIDDTVKWNTHVGQSGITNGVRVPARAGMCVEYWRRNRHKGGLSNLINPAAATIRSGRRYVPYFRGAPDVFAHPAADFNLAGIHQQNQRFKVCYYNPANGARSPLCTETIFVCRQGKAERTTAGDIREFSCVWIEM